MSLKYAKRIYEDIKDLCEQIDSPSLAMEVLSTEYDFLRAKSSNEIIRCAKNIINFLDTIPEEYDSQILYEIEDKIVELDENF